MELLRAGRASTDPSSVADCEAFSYFLTALISTFTLSAPPLYLHRASAMVSKWPERLTSSLAMLSLALTTTASIFRLFST